LGVLPPKLPQSPTPIGARRQCQGLLVGPSVCPAVLAPGLNAKVLLARIPPADPARPPSARRQFSAKPEFPPARQAAPTSPTKSFKALRPLMAAPSPRISKFPPRVGVAPRRRPSKKAGTGLPSARFSRPAPRRIKLGGNEWFFFGPNRQLPRKLPGKGALPLCGRARSPLGPPVPGPEAPDLGPVPPPVPTRSAARHRRGGPAALSLGLHAGAPARER